MLLRLWLGRIDLVLTCHRTIAALDTVSFLSASLHCYWLTAESMIQIIALRKISIAANYTQIYAKLIRIVSSYSLFHITSL